MSIFWLGNRDSYYAGYDRVPLDLFVGRDPEEVASKQRILATIELRFDSRVMERALKPGARGIDGVPRFYDKLMGLSDTTNYALLESLAAHIADMAVATLPLQAVTVEVQKPHRYGTLDGISVWCEYHRSNAIKRGLSSLANKLAPRRGRARFPGLSKYSLKDAGFKISGLPITLTFAPPSSHGVGEL